ncbi:hypothetical protein HBH56_236340 [Parastagonospora nodorum]|uniref:Uncharacterized protein n=1 Tax=Phaeosphaeria nodorum (strain SN15 / ATCC MYA-4574 / FGSC 10173) TaxID=321614 RepID=A0A7U2EQD0_PHANO|nr:hypothetical protein HBH56_236340 [Parastagonospora nodorum]QRC90932.1 hypothetical protein JI435_426150 [Parastagonospora nodorum SN15]KAH3934747.1 hypothetical protein HBH54_046390 [Parastagonospora nodorum]KAH3950367.1 hypothetical protein HBH53_077570 [Parastagonospora nodorum]KAH4060694.1 hypothetical protein HBH49_005390 [Parastagonospora nodorum]
MGFGKEASCVCGCGCGSWRGFVVAANRGVVVDYWVGILGTPPTEDNTTLNDRSDSMIGGHGKEAVCETPSRKLLDRKSGKGANYLDDDTKLERPKSKKK